MRIRLRSVLPAGCCLLWIAGATVQAAVTACADEGGTLTYTQFGCPAGTTPAPSASIGGEGRLSVVEIPALTDPERKALSRLEGELSRQRIREASARQRSAARRAADAERARTQCEAALRALALIGEQRRRGYTADEGRRFDADEARWNAIRRADC